MSRTGGPAGNRHACPHPHSREDEGRHGCARKNKWREGRGERDGRVRVVREGYSEEVTSEVGLKAKRRFCLKEKNIEECNAVQ